MTSLRLAPTAAMLLLAATLSGCLLPAGPTETGDVGGAPMIQERRHHYGTLAALERNGTEATLTIHASIADCERADTTVTQPASVAGLLRGGAAVPLAAEDRSEVLFRYRDATFRVTDPTRLEPGTLYYFIFDEGAGEGASQGAGDLYVFHAHDAANGTLELGAPEHPDEERAHVDARDGRFVEARRPWHIDDLAPGGEYAFTLLNVNNSGAWSLARVDADDAELRRACMHAHRDDVALQPHQGALAFPANATVPVNVGLKSTQDTALTYRFGAARLMDERVLHGGAPICPEGRDHVVEPGPAGEEDRRVECANETFQDRVDRAEVDGCVAHAPEEPRTLAPEATETEAIQVTCDHDVPEDEARWLVLWGNVTFTDELGNVHTLPHGPSPMLAQFVDVQPARLATS